MGRYYPDAERRRVAALIDAEVEKAREAERKGGWITYLIRDPRKSDRRGNPGLPIYVGQSKEFGRRVRARFDKCEKEATGKDSIERRVADLLHAGFVAQYQVLDRTSTRLGSLISETNWARECIRRGYDIANLLPEQRVPDPPITRQEIPTSWIWQFSIEEAIEDAVVLELGCRECNQSLDIDISYLKNTENPPKSLLEVKARAFWKSEPCTVCGTRGKRFARPRAT